MNKLFTILGIGLLIAVLAGVGLVVYDIHERHESPAVVVLPNGEQISVKEENITPKETAYQGQGITYHRKIEIARTASPFSLGAGETVSRVQPSIINVGNAPSINIDPNGVQVGEGSATTFKGTSGRFGFIDGIIQWFKDWGLTILIVVVVGGLALLIIPVIFPAAAPVVAAIWNGVKLFLAWLIPIFGGMWTWIKLHVFHVAATQIVDGNETFKKLVAAEPTFTDDVKARVLSLFAQAHDSAQDTSTQTVVKTLKMQLK